LGLNPGVFGAVTRAVELGIPTDGSRIRDFVTGALARAGLPVSKASAAISINEGQARLRDVVIRADGADLHATVNIDLADAMLDALLTLDALPQASGAASPAVMILLKGTLPAPRRVIDTNLLSSWLTLRALEQQSRQIEAMGRPLARRQHSPPRHRRRMPTRRGRVAAPSVVQRAYRQRNRLRPVARAGCQDTPALPPV
jgi:large subunit ribosomal protein L24